MLKSLYDYGIRRNLVPPAGCVKKTVKAYIVLSSSGKFIDIELGDDEAIDVPDIGSLAQGKDKSNILVEKRSIVVPDKPSPKSSFFLNTLKDGGRINPDLAVCAEALENEETVSKIKQELDNCKIKTGDRISFKVRGLSILKSEKTMEWWQEFRKQFQNTDSENLSLCLITGQPTVPVAVTKPVNGLKVVGGHGRGDSLICFDKTAFCSYNLKQAENAPVSEEAFSVVKAALDDLIDGAPILAGMKFVHWYDQDIPEEKDPIANTFGNSSDGENYTEEMAPEEQIQHENEARSAANALIESVRSGESAFLSENVMYHILLLSGVNGRVMIRRYDTGNYKDLQKNLKLWNDDLRLLKLGGTGYLSSCKLTARLLRLLSFQKSDKNLFERLKNELPGIIPAIINAILTGGRLPDAVAARSITYIRSQMLADASDPDAKGPPVPDGRACQWIKAWLIRKDREKGKELMEHYNLQHPEPAYHCGGLMAVYAYIQRLAMPNINAGIIQRYYVSAMRTPAIVFPQLEHLVPHYLDKLKNSYFLERQLSELADKIRDEIPRTLNLEEQSYFILGYRHKLSEFYTKKSDIGNTVEEDK